MFCFVYSVMLHGGHYCFEIISRVFIFFRQLFCGHAYMVIILFIVSRRRLRIFPVSIKIARCRRNKKFAGAFRGDFLNGNAPLNCTTRYLWYNFTDFRAKTANFAELQLYSLHIWIYIPRIFFMHIFDISVSGSI